MSRLGSIGHRLYTGDISIDFVGRRKLWFAISATVLLLALAGFFARGGLHLGIEFKGGSEFQLQSQTVDVQRAKDVVGNAGVTSEVRAQVVGSNSLRVETPQLSTAESEKVTEALAQEFGVDPASVSSSFVGPSWGSDISAKALRALIIFLVLVVIYLSMAFEWKMAVSAIVALLHDLLLTVGVYAVVGFEVTPATVIGLLTILGYSLYDTVVVFDKVRENTRALQSSSRFTYSEAANLGVNQTLVRSINTTIIALLPVGAILFVGAGLLGAGTLKDLSLALFIGLATGAYSSVFIATPLLALLKEREPQMQGLARRVAARRAGADGSSTSGRSRRAAAAGGQVTTMAVGGGATALAERDDELDESSPDGVALGADRPRTGPRNQPRRPARGRPSGRRRR